MPYSSNFQRVLTTVLIEQVDFQKTFPEVPKGGPCVKRQARIAADQTSRTRNTDGLTGNVILQSCAKIQDHGTLLHHSKSLPCLEVPEFEPTADSL